MGEEVFLDERDRPEIRDQPHWDDCVDHLSIDINIRDQRPEDCVLSPEIHHPI